MPAELLLFYLYGPVVAVESVQSAPRAQVNFAKMGTLSANSSHRNPQFDIPVVVRYRAMLETTFLYAFILGGGVLLLQVVLSLFGADDGSVEGGDIDFDAGMDGAEGHSTSAWLFDVISIRTLAAAATFFGLTGIAAQNYELSGPLAIVLATVAGLGAMYAVYWMFRQLYRLESSGAQDIRNAIGRPAEVYLRIPASGGGSGKVHLEMQGRTVEYLAVTEEKEPLDSGTQVFVSGIISSDTLQVTPSDGSLAS